MRRGKNGHGTFFYLSMHVLGSARVVRRVQNYMKHIIPPPILILGRTLKKFPLPDKQLLQSLKKRPLLLLARLLPPPISPQGLPINDVS